MKIDYVLIIYITLLALLLGVARVQRAMNNDPVVQEGIKGYIETFFKESLQADFFGDVEHVNLFFPTLTVRSVRVSSPDGSSWHWQADRISITFSWLQSFIFGYAALAVAMHEVVIDSLARDGALLIQDHCSAIIEGETPLPIRFKSLTFEKASCAVRDLHDCYALKGLLSLNAGMYKDRYRIKALLSDMSIKVGSHTIADQLQATLGIEVRKDQKSEECSLQGSLHCPLLSAADNWCTFKGHLLAGKGQIVLQNDSKKCVCALHDITLSDQRARYTLILPGSMLQACAPWIPHESSELSLQASGLCGFDSQGFFGESDIACDYSGVEDLPIDTIKGHIAFNQKHTKGALSLLKQGHESAMLSWHYDPHAWYKQFSVRIEQPLSYNGFVLSEWSEVRYTSTGKTGEGYCQIQGKMPWIESCRLQGVIASSDNQHTIRGILGDYSYEGILADQKVLVSVHDQKGAEVIQASWQPDYSYSCTVDVGFVQKGIKSLGISSIMGHGIVAGYGTLSTSRADCICSLQSGAIRLFKSNNLMQKFSAKASYDFDRRRLTVENCSFLFDKGSLCLPRSVISMNSDYTVRAIHAPLIVQSLFINYGKELSAILSGSLVLARTPHHGARTTGSLMIDHARCNTTALGSSMGGLGYFSNPLLIHEPITCDIALETKHALQLTMPFIHAAMKGRLVVQGTLHHPEIVGTLHMHDGTLVFPYHPLNITRGLIRFMPNQIQDPAIDFYARGKIRNYTVRMHCSGTAQQPRVTFEASPPLTEEQILTLLFAGSEAGSLSMIMPAMAMQRLKNIMLEPDSKESLASRYVKKLLSPLRFIRLVPHFSDQTARGGLRGAIEVDVSDHMRAIIQKNFSISEDSKIEVEYYLSDEITLRGVKDERSDIGAEIEVRWKL